MSRRLHLANIFLMIIAFSTATIIFLPSGKFVQVDLAADVINIAGNADPNLVNPWELPRRLQESGGSRTTVTAFFFG